ncbi:MAG: phage portal protein [Planctomycetota bacterium]|nr:phage portal protein [Planctomycetota bacterium]
MISMYNTLKNLFTRRSSTPLTRQQLQSIAYGGPTATGLNVSEENALTLAAVYSVVDAYSTTFAGLDFGAYDSSSGVRKELPSHSIAQLMRRPNEDMNCFKFKRAMIVPLMTSGNSYTEIVRRLNGRAAELHLLPWRNVEPRYDDNGRVCYYLRKEGRTLPSSDVIHLSGLSWNGLIGLSPVQAARQSLSIGQAAEKVSATVYQNGAVKRGFYKTDQKLDDDVIERLQRQFMDGFGGIDNAGKTPILEQGLDFVSTQFSPEDAAYITSRDFTNLDVCRIWRYPASMLCLGQSSYNANEENYRQWIQQPVRTLLEGIEAEFEFKLLRPEERDHIDFEFDLDCLLRGDAKARTESMKNLFLMGMLTPDEGRAREGLNPLDIEGSDKAWVPVNMRVMDAPQPPTNQPNPADPIGGQPGPLSDAPNAARGVIRENLARVLRRAHKGKGKPSWQTEIRNHCGEVLGATVALMGSPHTIEAVTDLIIDLAAKDELEDAIEQLNEVIQ